MRDKLFVKLQISLDGANVCVCVNVNVVQFADIVKVIKLEPSIITIIDGGWWIK